MPPEMPPQLLAKVARVATGDPAAPLPDGFPAEPLAREYRAVREALRAEPAGHEAATMVVLLGQRVAQLGLSAVHLARLAGLLTGEAGGGDGAGAGTDLGALLLDGYLRGREARWLAEHAERLREAQPMVAWAPRCVAWMLCGTLRAEDLEAAGERFARLALRQEARCAVLDLHGAPSPEPDRAAALAHGLELLRTTGCEPLLARVPPGWRAALDPSWAPRIREEVAEALREAERRAGLRLLRWPPWRR